MMETAVAQRYARALYEVALASKDVEDVLQSLSNLAFAVKSVPEFNRALFNPLLKPEDKRKVIRAVTSNKLALRLTELLAKRKRLALVPLVHDEFAAMVDRARGVRRALIRTAVPLTEAQRRDVEKGLAARIGGKIVGRFEVAKELIGGIWMQVGDKVLDATIRGRIDDFRHALANSAN